MFRNLFGIPAKGIVRQATIGLSAVVFSFALILNSFILWMLSMICLIVVFSQNRPGRQLRQLARDRTSGTPFLDPVERTLYAVRPVRRRGMAAHAGQEQAVMPVSGAAEPRLSRQGLSALQMLLYNTPPICLN